MFQRTKKLRRLFHRDAIPCEDNSSKENNMEEADGKENKKEKRIICLNARKLKAILVIAGCLFIFNRLLKTRFYCRFLRCRRRIRRKKSIRPVRVKKYGFNESTSKYRFYGKPYDKEKGDQIWNEFLVDVAKGQSGQQQQKQPDVYIHGKLVEKNYTKVPEQFYKTVSFYGSRKSISQNNLGEKSLQPWAKYAFLEVHGWAEVSSCDNAHVCHFGMPREYKEDWPTHLINKTWQRSNIMCGSDSWDNKNNILVGLREYYFNQQKQNKTVSALPGEEESFQTAFYSLPETYLLKDKRDFLAFEDRLHNKGGMDRPWVLKNPTVNQGKGIEVLGANSNRLRKVTERITSDTRDINYIIQEYVCNELTWFGGQKFDLRFFWVVISVDPPIVLFHNGYPRVSTATYQEDDFSDTDMHLTNHKMRNDKEKDVTVDFLWKLVRQHYDANYDELSQKLPANVTDPVEHVRNQMKDTIATFSKAFLSGNTRTFGDYKTNNSVVAENSFGFYGCDFIIDNDLDVYFIEPQTNPAMRHSIPHKKKLNHDLFLPLPKLLEEIQMKQERSPTENLLPLQNLGGYEIIRAGDWQFKYNGYKRNFQDKKSCSSDKMDESSDHGWVANAMGMFSGLPLN